MLNIFRKYQRYIYLVVTIVIIISFSFFGTYSTLGSNTWREQLAFKAVNGDEVTRSEVDDMSNFISTDNSDKMAYGGAWGPNFLNDGVITKDFLQTGLAEELLVAYSEEIHDEWIKRAEKEKKFNLYTNPKAAFIGVEQAWNYFAPDMSKNFHSLRSAQNPTDQQAINDRINLFLAQKKTPSSMLKKILRYQEQQFDWLTPDYSLDNRDLSLFGYHTLNDWFSAHFTTIVSQFIINAAILAESKGYTVSRAEAMADLARNTQISYSENVKNPNLGVASPQEYFNEQLRLLNMDQGAALKVWQQVLLFRRYFQDAGQSAFVDTLAFKNFDNYANEVVTADVYHLPASLQLKNYKDLQNFQMYLQAVSETSPDSLALPTEFLSAEEVSKKYPELVQKSYVLNVAQVNQKALQSKISIKDLWAWETEDKNWDILRAKFPELGIKTGETVEERFELLEDLAASTRTRVDSFAKNAIIETHPDWINQALSNAPVKKISTGIRLDGEKMPFDGLDTREKREAFTRYLDEAPLGQEIDSSSPLYTYTADHKNYYRIEVLERTEDLNILTFAEANSDQTLNLLTDRVLEEYYLANREKHPETYQQDNKEWKSFKSVRDVVADEYFANLWKNIEEIKQKLQDNDPIYASMGKDQLVALRFYPYFQEVKEKISQEPSQVHIFIRNSKEDDSVDPSNELVLNEQWKLEHENVTMSRENTHDLVEVEEAFELAPTAWSHLKPNFNGDLVIFQVINKGMSDENKATVAKKTLEAQSHLSSAAQRALMQGVLKELKEKDAISLAYLKSSQESIEDKEGMN